MQEWIAAVARLRDRREILKQHGVKDEGLTIKFLEGSKVTKSNAVAGLNGARQQLRDDGKKRQVIRRMAQITSDCGAMGHPLT